MLSGTVSEIAGVRYSVMCCSAGLPVWQRDTGSNHIQCWLSIQYTDSTGLQYSRSSCFTYSTGSVVVFLCVCVYVWFCFVGADVLHYFASVCVCDVSMFFGRWMCARHCSNGSWHCLCVSLCLSVCLSHQSSAGSVCLSLFHYLPTSLSLSQSVSLALTLCLWLAQLFWCQSNDFAGQSLNSSREN